MIAKLNQESFVRYLDHSLLEGQAQDVCRIILVNLIKQLQEVGEAGLTFVEAMLISPHLTLFLKVFNNSFFNKSFY